MIILASCLKFLNVGSVRLNLTDFSSGDKSIQLRQNWNQNVINVFEIYECELNSAIISNNKNNYFQCQFFYSRFIISSLSVSVLNSSVFGVFGETLTS